MGRIQSIDALRGLVMVIMLLDHTRETFYLHRQVSDPVDVLTTEPALVFLRLLSSLCAPVFVLLTGLGAWLYCQNHGKAKTSAFLLKRGLLLIALELTVINFSWTGTFPPTTFYLQVIWVIGISMIALAGALYLKRWQQIFVAVFLVVAHHAFEVITIDAESALSIPWAVLYERDWITIAEGVRARTSYPLLPWIGIITLGYLIGPWFSGDSSRVERSRALLIAGIVCLGLFVLLRWVNVYGDAPRMTDVDAFTSLLSFVSLTKYPPSFLFSLSTIGLGALLLAWFERLAGGRALSTMATFGAAPMFFYILHLYVLKVFYLLGLIIVGRNQGAYFGFSSVFEVWAAFAALGVALYFPTAWFARLKQRRRDIALLRYF